MILMKEKIMVVALPLPSTGGGMRALRSINEYTKHFDVHLFLPYGIKRYAQTFSESLSNFIKSRIIISGFSKPSTMIEYLGDTFIGRVLHNLLNPMFILKAKPKLFLRYNYKCVISLHETMDSIYAGYILKEIFNIPAVCMLQLPPFYGSRERLRNIMKSHILWRKYTMISDLVKSLSTIETILEYNVTNSVTERIHNHILQRYDIIMAVSRSIPYEMGGKWIDKVYAFNPGVSLDEEDLKTIESIKSRVKDKDKYMVFGGRPIAAKGLVEALIVLKLISKRFSHIRLVFTGSIDSNSIRKIMYICKKLGIEDKVAFTGFLPRDKRFEIVAKATLMLYPSHVDSFPYAVLEALHLGTPVVAYNIPALEIYYSRSPGVKLVKEWDLETLAVEAINVLEKGIETIEPPKIPSWREIMNMEIDIIKKLIEKFK